MAMVRMMVGAEEDGGALDMPALDQPERVASYLPNPGAAHARRPAIHTKLSPLRGVWYMSEGRSAERLILSRKWPFGP